MERKSRRGRNNLADVEKETLNELNRKKWKRERRRKRDMRRQRKRN